MIIGYKKDVDGILRAAIALKRNPGSTMVCGSSKRELKEKLAVYHGEIVVDVEDVVKDVPFHTKVELWVKFPRCGGMQPSISLGSFLTYSLRHSICLPDELVRLLALNYPELTVLLAHKDATAKKYYHYYRETMCELQRLKAHVRFKPAGDILYVEITPKHDINDLFMEWAAERNKDRRVIVKCHGEYYLLNARSIGYRTEIASISEEEAMRMLGNIPDIESEIWDTFYDSQNVESRRNKGYAKSRLPEKYSYISPEIRKDRKKVEHGISKNKLEDFIENFNEEK
jgi:hypothetical protein